ncbi:uncharacterized protein SCHCODRAFT_02617078 [Schizophyllum commune H4-8]|uniref:Expressed protein n=1 Tax=Schizophyllum commune (strain H4-8 / FGSC 9210) TaxID=578458 RepID=D8Q2K2_SCHCM|nr:uncharacterized protein SCHCODRAFT_02617078 [Schizophyllum commune H4-8]KAI5894477.1 hypothetical protein SCHCODRAFT_02617078 [Schizophyllum commune H4-8]
MPWSSTHSGWRSRATPYNGPTPDLAAAELKFAVKISAPAGEYPLLAVFAGPSSSSTPSSPSPSSPSPESNFAIDAKGHVLRLAPEDFTALTALARGVDAMHDAGVYDAERRGAWRVKSPITCRPFHVLLVPQPPESAAVAVAAAQELGKDPVEGLGDPARASGGPASARAEAIAEGELSAVEGTPTPVEDPKPTLRRTSVYAFKKENAELSTPVGELTQLPAALVEFFGLAEEAQGEGEADKEVLDKVNALLRGER